jgi:hypothetical protein
MKNTLASLIVVAIAIGGYFVFASNAAMPSLGGHESAAGPSTGAATSYCGGVGRGGSYCNNN